MVFSASTQGGEAGRVKKPGIFSEVYKSRLTSFLMKEAEAGPARSTSFMCADYEAPYWDLAPYADYPGHVVNCNPKLTNQDADVEGGSADFQKAAHGRNGPAWNHGQRQPGTDPGKRSRRH